MQIVIEIPEKEYLRLKEPTALYWDSVLYKAIADGKPLPKGHGRLIDERLLREDMERAYKYANELVALGFAESFLEHAPTIIGEGEEADE